MKSLIAVLFLVAALQAGAANDCYRVVLDDYSRDSNSFQIYDEDIAAEFEEAPQRAALMAINALERELGCREKSFQKPSVKCNDIVEGNPISRVCYAEVEEGYFFISLDMLEKVNIIFNRWD